MKDSIPYCRHETGEAEEEALLAVLRSGWIARGPLAGRFEDAVAQRVGASHAVACSSGTSALELALRAAEIGPGDEVLVPSLTWVATAMAVRLVGATPVFVDIDPRTFCASARDAAGRVTPRTRAAVVVDFAGRGHDLPAWRGLCRQHGITLVADAAHAFGGSYPDGTAIGGDEGADLTTFSFHPAKTITTGEGGMVTTASPELDARLRVLRAGGMTRDFPGRRGPWDFCVTHEGGNHHLTELQAAMGLAQLEKVEDFLARRRRGVQHYARLLGTEESPWVLPEHPGGSACNLYVVSLPDSPGGVLRNEVANRLRLAGINCAVHYALLHRQPLFTASAEPVGLPHSEAYERRALTLPLYPGLEPGELALVARKLGEAVRICRKLAGPGASKGDPEREGTVS
jgi:perosamine synthetase